MSKRKLLLADDSLTIQKVVNLTFADEGIEVTAVGDGNSAMDKFIENVPDLVMVDVNMPGFDGYKICEIIKRNDETKHIPVILLVGSFERFDEEEARRVGADDYMTKPFQSIRQLVAKVTGLLDSTDGSAPKESAEQSNQAEIPPAAETQDFTSVSADADFPQSLDGQSSTDGLVYSDVDTTDGEDVQKTQPLSAEDARWTDSVYGSGSGGTATATAREENIYDFGGGEAAQPKTAEYPAIVSLENNADQSFSATPNFVDEELPKHNLQSGSANIASGQNPSNSLKFSFAAVELDEDDLLEIPFMDGEYYSPESGTGGEVELTENSQVEEVALPAVVENGAAEAATAETFAAMDYPSPELIDQIADKVVEKLSDKVIREIAREIVPQMADSIIREMAREKLNA